MRLGGVTSSESANEATKGILVSSRQKQNPLLSHISNVFWQYADIVADYQPGSTTAALFISLRYHLQKPDYIHQRMRGLRRSFRLRIVLCLMDTEDVERGLLELDRACALNDFALICAWSNKEAARYLETMKAYENKPADAIQERVDQDYMSQLTSCLTAIHGINRMDVSALGSKFGSLADILAADHARLASTPGVGTVKARRLHEAFKIPVSYRSPSASVNGQQVLHEGGGEEGNEDPDAGDD